MGVALIKIKIMPSSVEEDLKLIEKQSEKTIIKGKGTHYASEEQNIAFGLKAIIISFALDESLELEKIERDLEKIKGINSVQVIDMRRAFG
jgi:translation elongation factor aEF-1 beta